MTATIAVFLAQVLDPYRLVFSVVLAVFVVAALQKSAVAVRPALSAIGVVVAAVLLGAAIESDKPNGIEAMFLVPGILASAVQIGLVAYFVRKLL